MRLSVNPHTHFLQKTWISIPPQIFHLSVEFRNGQNGPPENLPEKFPENSPGTIRPSTSTQPSIVLDRTVQHYIPEPFGYWGVGGSRECLPLSSGEFSGGPFCP
ncbi:hypothetical protein YC2023_004778 [Brassica napus]